MSGQRRNLSVKFKSEIVIKLLKGEENLKDKLAEECREKVEYAKKVA